MTVRPRVLVLSSCTGLKEESSGGGLVMEDFLRGRQHVQARHASDLEQVLTAAENLYRGQQHLRLMRGVRAARAADAFDLDLRILSAGYGVVRASDFLAPYECSLGELPKAQRLDWTRRLGVESDVRSFLAERYSLALILLGEEYLEVCGLSPDWDLGGPTAVLCGAHAALRLPPLLDLCPLVLTKRDATRFSCGLVGLKGEVAGRLLALLAAAPDRLAEFSVTGLLDQLVRVDIRRDTPSVQPLALF